ncbi:hypothetical protein PtB15_7B357 [Puccinia triticina]|nr:hypothetical protein PtB15_7B357 [Puccinia triticina]
MAQSGLHPLAALLNQVNLPTARSVVYREECTQCFDSQDSPSGIDVCLTCFNGGCVHFKHASNHAQKTGHRLAMNVQRTRKPDSHQRSPSAEPPLKKLAITEQTEDQFDTKTSLVHYASADERKQFAFSDVAEPKIEQAAAAILSASSSAQASEVKAWEEEIETCRHVVDLSQDPNAAPVAQASATCHACELSSNLWFCLQCGSLGCGRPQYGGSGGNGHALQHYEQTGHCVNVKMGTITAEGTADLYCYSCDDARTDDRLQEHLAHFSIEIAKQEKTEKSMTELQVEHNMKFDFAMSGEEGRELHPIEGPGFTGLKNLGNSCYIASVLQVLFALPPFQKRYFQGIFELHSSTCEAASPADCFDCQMSKIAHGMLSGRYAVSRCTGEENGARDGSHVPAQATKSFQEGIKPMMFKAFVGKGHPEFSTMRQQDADEFMRYLFQFIQRQARQSPAKASLLSALAESDLDPTLPFRFELEEKLQCTSCQCVRYRYEEQEALSLPVPAVPVTPPAEPESAGITPPGQTTYQPVSLEECLESFTTPQTVEYNCPRCKSKTTALTTSRIASFPKYLAIHTRRFAIVNWVPKKLEIPVIIQGHQVDLEKYFGRGIQPGEETLPEVEERAPEVSVNPETLSALESMGFPTAKCRKAILETGDSGVESATSWLFEHMDDVEVAEAPSAQVSHNEEHVSMLMEMGFTSNQAKKALGETDGNVERAVEWLFSHPDDDGSTIANVGSTVTSEPAGAAVQNGTRVGDKSLPARFKLRGFISHKGPSVFSGHYVAHVNSNLPAHSPSALKGEHWVLFNDEKVAVAEQGPLSHEAMAPLAYIYLFERIEEQK